MSTPNDVNVNVSHSICDFRARHKLSAFDGAPMSPSARRQTNRKSLGRGRPAQRRREPGGRQRRRSWREEQGMALFVAFSHHNPTAAKPDRDASPGARVCGASRFSTCPTENNSVTGPIETSSPQCDVLRQNFVLNPISQANPQLTNIVLTGAD